jgi:hypothetical protein
MRTSVVPTVIAGGSWIDDLSGNAAVDCAPQQRTNDAGCRSASTAYTNQCRLQHRAAILHHHEVVLLLAVWLRPHRSQAGLFVAAGLTSPCAFADIGVWITEKFGAGVYVPLGLSEATRTLTQMLPVCMSSLVDYSCMFKHQHISVADVLCEHDKYETQSLLSGLTAHSHCSLQFVVD